MVNENRYWYRWSVGFCGVCAKSDAILRTNLHMADCERQAKIEWLLRNGLAYKAIQVLSLN